MSAEIKEMSAHEQFMININSKRNLEKIERYKMKAKENKKQHKLTNKMKTAILKRAEEMKRQYGL